MERAKRRVLRHILAAICLVLAVVGGFIPIFQGWMFFLMAILLLAIDYRWIRDLVLRRLYRWFPKTYQKASRWRRRMRIKCARRFGYHKQYHVLHPPRRAAPARKPSPQPRKDETP